MKTKYKLICFDMDGTIITNTNSVSFLCLLNNKIQEENEINIKEENNEISWIQADYLKANLMKGLKISKIKDSFSYLNIIKGLDELISYIHSFNIKTMLITAGPFQVANLIGEYYRFENCYGSYYEIIENEFTGNILNHIGPEGKLNILKDHCKLNNIELDEVISVGDNASDIDIFQNTGLSIAINYSKTVEGKADYYINTDSIMDILKFID